MTILEDGPSRKGTRPPTPPTSDAFVTDLQAVMQRHGVAALSYTIDDDGIHAHRHVGESWHLGWVQADAREIAAQPGEGGDHGQREWSELHVALSNAVGTYEESQHKYANPKDRVTLRKQATLIRQHMQTLDNSPPHVADALDGERIAFCFANDEWTFGHWLEDDMEQMFLSADEWREAVDAARAEAGDNERGQFSKCDNCGSGVWNTEWDPECRERKSKKFYCPNCTGAT